MSTNEVPTVNWVSDQTEPNPPLVRLANGSPFPERMTARTAVGDGPSITFSVVVEDGRPVMTHFAVDRRPGGSAVTASFIHDLPVSGLVDQLIAYLGWGADLMQTGHDEPNVVHVLPTDAERKATGDRAVASQRGRPVSVDDLRMVAAIIAGNEYDPRRQVVRELHLSDRTASRWIAEARRRGFVDEVSSTKEV